MPGSPSRPLARRRHRSARDHVHAGNPPVNTFQTTLIYVLASLIYLLLCLPLVVFLRSLEKRMAAAS